MTQEGILPVSLFWLPQNLRWYEVVVVPWESIALGQIMPAEELELK